MGLLRLLRSQLFRSIVASGWLKRIFLHQRKYLPRKLQIQAAYGVARATRRRKGPGISSEIETCQNCGTELADVEPKGAWHLI